MSTDCAVCYVADLNFLLPTLVSATGLRKFVPAHKADVFIFLVDQEARVAELNRVLNPLNIQVVPMESRLYSGFDTDKFNKCHVPLAALGRFFVESALPQSCRRIVYMDGDTWARHDPSPLIEAVVPEGKFAAIEDMISFRSKEKGKFGRAMLAYIKRLGVDRKKNGYFNSGVFATSRNTWREVAPAAYKFIAENTVLCELHDQSALNAVVGDRRLRLSLKWNFQTPFRYSGMERYVDPYIYHFTRYPKPWVGKCRPWEDIYEPYRAAMAPFETMKLPVKTISSADLEWHNKLNWRKNLLMKWGLTSKFTSMYLGIEAYEKEAWL